MIGKGKRRVSEEEIKKDPPEQEKTEEKQPASEENTKAEENTETEENKEETSDHKHRDSKKKLEAELEELRKKLEEQKAEAKENYLRKVAEFDNYKKRTEKEKMESVSLGIGSSVEAFIPVLDSLQRAAGADCQDENYKKGILMTLDLFRKSLDKLGVKEIEAEGKKFDPKYHNAVMTEQVEGVESGTVTKVLQSGYIRGDRVIRCAIVAVAE